MADGRRQLLTTGGIELVKAGKAERKREKNRVAKEGIGVLLVVDDTASVRRWGAVVGALLHGGGGHDSVPKSREWGQAKGE